MGSIRVTKKACWYPQPMANDFHPQSGEERKAIDAALAKIMPFSEEPYLYVNNFHGKYSVVEAAKTYAEFFDFCRGLEGRYWPMQHTCLVLDLAMFPKRAEYARLFLTLAEANYLQLYFEHGGYAYNIDMFRNRQDGVILSVDFLNARLSNDYA